LDDVHAVDAEGLDLDDGLARPCGWLGRFRIDEEGISLAFAALDVCGLVLAGGTVWRSGEE
jgi:hypothetical protein